MEKSKIWTSVALKFIGWIGACAVALTAILVIVGIAGYKLPLLPWETEVSGQYPFSNFVGKELQVSGWVEAVFHNDYPDKEKILSITLTCGKVAQNRFVSSVRQVSLEQSVIIERAGRSFLLVDTQYYYRVLLPGLGFPDGVPIKLKVGADGVPDAHCFTVAGN